MSAPEVRREPFVGTEKLGRPLTEAESAALAKLLRDSGYVEARLIALRFAFKLTRSKEAAQDIMGRAELRLVRTGWDPGEVNLRKRLCRLVFSEFTHERDETAKRRHAEGVFVNDQRVGGGSMPSPEAQVIEEEIRREREIRAKSNLDALRAAFEKAGDKTNLVLLDQQILGEKTLEQIAKDGGYDVKDLYAAVKRRNTAVRRLLALARGIEWKEEDE